MAKPVNQQIFDNVITTLQGVTVANGYRQTIRQVLVSSEAAQSKFVHGYPSVDLFIDKEDKDDSMDMGLNHCYLNITIGAYTDDVNDPVEALSYLCADIEKALMVDHTRNSLAIDTEITSIDRIYVNDRAQFGFTALAEITTIVKYRHSRGNPYSLR